MNFIPILAITTKADTSVMDALPYSIGALIVIGTLAFLWGVCALNAWLIKTFVPERAAPAPKPMAASAAGTPVTTGGITPQIVAVVAAAVATATNRPHRIVSIKHQSSSWSKAGRQSVLTSHKIR